MQRNWHNDAAALWVAPIVAAITLALFMSIPALPFYLGRLMDDPTHPMNWPRLGPLIAALAVVFDAGILGILAVLVLVAPAYAGLRKSGTNTARNILLPCAGAGIAASQVARLAAQGVRQTDLRAFANSATSPILGCLCGLAAGGFIAYFANRRIARTPVWCVPVAAFGIAAVAIAWSGAVWRSH